MHSCRQGLGFHGCKIELRSLLRAQSIHSNTQNSILACFLRCQQSLCILKFISHPPLPEVPLVSQHPLYGLWHFMLSPLVM